MNKTKGCLIANFATVPYFFTIVQTETVNTGVDMPGKPL
nr:hypothetical protein [Escherichia coli]